MTALAPFNQNDFCQEVRILIAETETLAQSIADQLRLNLDEEVAQGLLELIDHSQLLVDCLLALRSSPGARVDEGWQMGEQSLINTVRGMLSAFEKRDLVLVADLIEYKLIQTLQVWDEIIERSGEPYTQNPMGR